MLLALVTSCVLQVVAVASVHNFHTNFWQTRLQVFLFGRVHSQSAAMPPSAGMTPAAVRVDGKRKAFINGEHQIDVAYSAI